MCRKPHKKWQSGKATLKIPKKAKMFKLAGILVTRPTKQATHYCYMIIITVNKCEW